MSAYNGIRSTVHMYYIQWYQEYSMSAYNGIRSTVHMSAYNGIRSTVCMHNRMAVFVRRFCDHLTGSDLRIKKTGSSLQNQ